MPCFQDLNAMRERSMNWAASNRPTFIGRAQQAIGEASERHAREQKARRRRPAAKG